MHGPAIDTRIDGLLNVLWQNRGTDLLLTAGACPQIRVHGELRAVPGEPVLTGHETDQLLTELFTVDQSQVWETAREFDFSFGWRELARVRGNAFRQRGETAVALRMIPQTVPTLAQLGLPRAVHDFAAMHQGLVLVTGPTGSGKSTTIAAVIDQINSIRACHIITIEDPIEYVHAHKRSTVSQREVGSDTRSFPDALRSALREDPDVLLVGEMRDLESIRFALTIAETGHLVFASLHTNDSSQALARMIDVFPAEQQDQVRVQLAAALTGIVYQRLVPKIGGGLAAAYEVLVGTPAVRNLIREGKTNQLRNCIVTGARYGMTTLEHSLNAMVASGSITYEDAVARSLYPKDVEPHPLSPVSVMP
jgi:twitching motility protein PilT